tara:strand:- start:831 stop:1094 length:264 start_codon:yes stop_codon:yes gene_type:complete
MKCRYTSNVPTLLIVGDKLTSVTNGDVIEVDTLPSGDFVSLEKKSPPKKVPTPVPSKPVVAQEAPTAKKSPPKEINNGSKTETRSLG